MRASDTHSGVLELAGAQVCAFFTFGTGSVPVLCDRHADGEILRLRIDFG